MKWDKWLENWDMKSLRVNAVFLNMEWKPQIHDKEAAWELYIELLTRISTQPLPEVHGDDKTALESVYSIFPVTRETINRVTELIGRDLLESLPHLRTWMETGFRGAAGNGLSTQAAILKASFKVKDWKSIPIERVRATFETFAEGIARGDLTRITPATFRKYRAMWDARMVNGMRELQREFSRAAATGSGLAECVDVIEPGA